MKILVYFKKSDNTNFKNHYLPIDILNSLEKCSSHKPRRLPNQEIQTDFAGPVNNEKEHEIHLLTCIDKFLKNASAEIFEIANSSIVIKFLDNYLQFHGVLRYFRIDEASFLTGNQEKNI